METLGTITLGKNLRRIRKELQINQKEMVGKEFTRELISMIENDKSPMSYKIAKSVAENMNRVCRKRGLEVYVDPEDIMNPKRMVVKKQANKYICKLRNHINNKNYDVDTLYIEKITNFLNQWKIPEKKVEIYVLLGELSYLNEDLEWEYLYLNKALENYFLVPVKNNIHIIGNKLIENCISNKRYKEALTLTRLDIMNTDDIPKKDKAVIYYNKALVYKRLKEYDNALEIIEEYKSYWETNNKEMFKKALILKGSCYSKKNQNYEAIKVYKEIIKLFGECSPEAGLAYANIMNNYYKLDLREEVIKYKAKLLSILSYIEKRDNKYLENIYTRLGEISKYLNRVEMAEYFYISAINKAVESKYNNSTKILFKLLNLYNDTNQSEKILLSNKIFERSFQNVEISNELKLALSLILMNMEIGKEEIASSIINNILRNKSSF